MGSSRKVLRAVYCARLYGNNGHGLVDGVRCCAARVLRSARPEQISPMSREGRFLPRPRSLRVCMSHWLVHWRGLSRSRRLMDFNQGALTMVRLMWKRFSGCESGAILSAEIVVVGTVLILGLITGLTGLQHALTSELQDLSGAFGALDQSYCFSGHAKIGFCDRICAYNSGSCFLDLADCSEEARAHAEGELRVPSYIKWDERPHSAGPCPDCGRTHGNSPAAGAERHPEHRSDSRGDGRSQPPRPRPDESRESDRRPERESGNEMRPDQRSPEGRLRPPVPPRGRNSETEESRQPAPGRRSVPVPEARDKRDAEESRGGRRDSDQRNDSDQGKDEVRGESTSRKREDDLQTGTPITAGYYVLTSSTAPHGGCDHCGGHDCDGCGRQPSCRTCGYLRPEGGCGDCGHHYQRQFRDSCGRCGLHRSYHPRDAGYGYRERCTQVRGVRVTESMGYRRPYPPYREVFGPVAPYPVHPPLYHGGPAQPRIAPGPGPMSGHFPEGMPEVPPGIGAVREFHGPAAHAPGVFEGAAGMNPPGHFGPGPVPPVPVGEVHVPHGRQNVWSHRVPVPHGPVPRGFHGWRPAYPFEGNLHEPRFPEYVW